MKLHLNQKQIETICAPILTQLAKQESKIFTTRGGNVAVVFLDNVGEDQIIMGMYYTASEAGEGDWLPARWYVDGRYHPKQKSLLDLVKTNVDTKESA